MVVLLLFFRRLLLLLLIRLLARRTLGFTKNLVRTTEAEAKTLDRLLAAVNDNRSVLPVHAAATAAATRILFNGRNIQEWQYFFTMKKFPTPSRRETAGEQFKNFLEQRSTWQRARM
jgi:hypothetical protein